MNVTHFLYGILSGMLPALLWLWFWLREDKLSPEPKGKVALAFLGGMLAVITVLPIQILIRNYVNDVGHQYALWACSEEILKFLFALALVLRKPICQEPIDVLIYMITVALGFAALENTLFALGPLADGNVVGTLVTSNMRFIGATLLHVVCSSCIGLALALSYYKNIFIKFISLVVGIALACALHGWFNLLIIRSTALDTFKIFGFVWVGVVILLLFFEKIKTLRPRDTSFVEDLNTI